MSRSKATSEFRKLLDERGVEYGPNGEETLVRLDGKSYRIWAYDNERLVMSIAYLTPEQAIAATLGSDDRYDAGFASGVQAVFQQLEGIEDYEGLQDLIAEYWGEGEGNDER